MFRVASELDDLTASKYITAAFSWRQLGHAYVLLHCLCFEPSGA